MSSKKITDIFTKRWSPRFKWLMSCSSVYLVLAIVLKIFGDFDYLSLLQFVWIAVMALPFAIPSLKRWLKMDRPIPKDQW